MVTTTNLTTQLAIKALDETGDIPERVAGKFRRMARAINQAAAAPVGALRSAAVAAERIDRTTARLGAAVAAGYAASKVAAIVRNVADVGEKYDDLVRYQRAVMGISPDQQKPLIDQAIKLGGSTPFNDLQVLEAQLSLAQRGIQEKFIIPIIDAAKNYAQAMNTDLPAAAQAVEGMLFSTGKVITDAKEAAEVSQRAVDEMAKAAKISGFSDDDMRQYVKYSGLAGSTAGLSDAAILALGALMHRANIPGDEAGVATRALAGRLVAPTGFGLDALAAMGIDFNRFTSIPGGLSPANLQTFMTQKFGRNISGAGMAHVAAIMANPEIVGDRSQFIAKMFDALAPGFGHGRGGKMRAQDSKKLTMAISDFYKDSVGKVDSEGLLRAIMAAHPTLGQLNDLFGQKQGARIDAALRDLDRFNDYENQIAHVPAGFAKGIGDERMGGYAGAKKRAEGSWLNVETALFRDFESQMTGANNVTARLEQGFVELDQHTQKEIVAVVGVTAAMAGLGAATKVLSLGIGGTAAAIGRFVPLVSMLAALPEIAMLAADVGKAAQDKFGNQQTIGTVPGVGWVPGADTGTAAFPHYTVSDIAKSLGMPAVSGSADLNVQVQVEPSDSFVSRIVSALRNDISAFGGGGTSGSTGVSMPEATPNP